jgi:NodT family efflux transporter outer membrane factor (OMF) lipoprotein
MRSNRCSNVPCGHHSTGSTDPSPSRGTLACTLLLALLTAACTTVGPDFQKPEAPVADDWQDIDAPQLKEEIADHSEWWSVFDDPILSELIESAYQQNLTLRIAAVRILEARAQLGIAVGNLYPQQQEASGGIIYTSSSENLANTVAGDLNFTDFDVGLDVAWETDFWGKFRRGIESADASFLSSIADYDDVLVSLEADVANTYTLIRTFEQRIDIAKQNVEIQKRSVEIADVLFRNGATTELDVQQAKSLLFNTQASIPGFETGLRQAQNALSILLGLPPGQLAATLRQPAIIPSASADVAVGIPAELLRRRPDVKRAELQAASQSAIIGVAKADLYPSFALFGSIGLAASSGTNTTRTGESGFDELLDSDSLFFVGGPTFNWPIFNYGRIRNNVRVQDARFQQLLVNYQNTVLRAAQEAEDSMTAFLRSGEEVGYRFESEKAALRAVDLALIQYREGATDYTTVLNTQQTLVATQDQLTAVRGEVAQNLIALYKALGGGWQMRQGRALLPQATKEEMRERTNWGHLLDPDAEIESSQTGEPHRRPDW